MLSLFTCRLINLIISQQVEKGKNTCHIEINQMLIRGLISQLDDLKFYIFFRVRTDGMHLTVGPTTDKISHLPTCHDLEYKSWYAEVFWSSNSNFLF